MHKVLLIGPLPPPITGPTTANTLIYNSLSSHHGYSCAVANTNYSQFENLGKIDLKKIVFYVWQYRYLFKIPKSDTVYIIPGQTFLGVVRYAPFIYLAKVLKKQILVQIRGDHLHLEYYEAAPWKKKIIHNILSKVSKGIVLSQKLRRNMLPFLPDENIFNLKNFAEDHLISKDNKNIIHTDHLRILFLSNLIPEKGIFDLLEALLILKENNVKFSAQIAGGVSDCNKEKIEILLNRIGKQVTYLGVVSGLSKRNTFHESNIFVFPTYYPMEGQPISIIEAMATGNVIVTTNHAGICDIFEDNKNGYYIEKKSPQNIADKLTEISNKLPELENIMLTNIKEVEQQYTTQKFMSNLLKIIEEPNARSK